MAFKKLYLTLGIITLAGLLLNTKPGVHLYHKIYGQLQWLKGAKQAYLEDRAIRTGNIGGLKVEAEVFDFSKNTDDLILTPNPGNLCPPFHCSAKIKHSLLGSNYLHFNLERNFNIEHDVVGGLVGMGHVSGTSRVSFSAMLSPNVSPTPTIGRNSEFSFDYKTDGGVSVEIVAGNRFGGGKIQLGNLKSTSSWTRKKLYLKFPRLGSFDIVGLIRPLEYVKFEFKAKENKTNQDGTFSVKNVKIVNKNKDLIRSEKQKTESQNLFLSLVFKNFQLLNTKDKKTALVFDVINTSNKEISGADIRRLLGVRIIGSDIETPLTEKFPSIPFFKESLAIGQSTKVHKWAAHKHGKPTQLQQKRKDRNLKVEVVSSLGNILLSQEIGFDQDTAETYEEKVSLYIPKLRAVDFITRGGSPEVKSPRKLFASAVNPNWHQIQSCAHEASDQSGLFNKSKISGGRIYMSWVMGPKGNLENLEITRDDIKNKKLKQCILKRFKEFNVPGLAGINFRYHFYITTKPLTL